MFPLVNSGILLSSNSFPHGHPKPVVPCVFLTYNILFDLSSGFAKSQSHLSNPLPLPGVRQTSSLPGTIGCCVPGGDPGHLAGGWEVHEDELGLVVDQKVVTGRWEVVGSSISGQCRRKFV